MSDYEIIAEGKYSAIVMDVDFTEGKKAPQVAIQFKITDEGEFENRYISYFGSFSDAAREYTFEALEAAGWTGGDIKDAIDECPRTLCTIVVKHSTWDGKTRAKVRFVNKPGGGELKGRLEGKAREDFFANINRQYKASKAGQAPQEEPDEPFRKKTA